MTIDIALLITGISCLCAFLGYQKGLKKDSRQEGEGSGELKADIKYIRNGVEDIKVDMRVQDQKIDGLAERITRVEESTKQSHHRIDELKTQKGVD